MSHGGAGVYNHAGKVSSGVRMDNNLLLLLLIIILMVLLSRSKARRQDHHPTARLRPDNRNQEQNAVDKMESAIRLFRGELDPTKLAAGNAPYTQYYIGYLSGIAETIGQMNDIESDFALHKPVILEAMRLKCCDLREGENYQEALQPLLENATAQAGKHDGTTDATLALTRGYEGPYWEELERFFNHDQITGDRLH